jgi:hypothetical protein
MPVGLFPYDPNINTFRHPQTGSPSANRPWKCWVHEITSRQRADEKSEVLYNSYSLTSPEHLFIMQVSQIISTLHRSESCRIHGATYTIGEKRMTMEGKAAQDDKFRAASSFRMSASLSIFLSWVASRRSPRATFALSSSMAFN